MAILIKEEEKHGILKLIGVVIVIIGFAIKFDTIATVVIAGLATGLVAGMTPMEIFDTLGKSFISNRTATLFVLTLPVIGVCERYGLKEKAIDFIRSIKNATTGRVILIYQAIRTLAAAFSVRLGGHPQFVRPVVVPMAEGAASKYGEVTPEVSDVIRGASAAAENYGNFYAQNCFMGASGTLLIVATLVEQGFDVSAVQIATWSIPIAVTSVLVGIVRNLMLDKKIEKMMNAGGGAKR